MRSEALAGASSSAAYASEHRGAGGKLHCPFNRKLPSTPYDRPLGQQRWPGLTAGGGGGWMSKIVNPAYRLIAGGAARFVPSVFSSSSTNSLPAPLPPPTEAAEEDEGPSEQEERPDIFYSAEGGRGKLQHPAGDPDGPDLSQIGQLIKGKTFCREEIDGLMGILQARVVDAEGGGHISNVSTAEKAEMKRSRKILMKIDLQP